MADPAKWGPGLWTYLHALPRHSESPESAKATLLHLDLPCAECRKHYRGFLAARPIGGLKTVREIEHWVFDLHNEVNARLGKPVYTFEACQADCAKLSEEPVVGKLFY